jgi:hypothetical protein
LFTIIIDKNSIQVDQNLNMYRPPDIPAPINQTDLMIEPIIIRQDPSTSTLTGTPNLNDTVTPQFKDDNRLGRHKNHPKAPTKKRIADDEPGSSEKADQPLPVTRRSGRRA